MSFNDTIDNMTGRQIKDVQALTGESIQKSTDMIGLIFAAAYVHGGGTNDKAGFNAYLDTTTYKAASAAVGADETVPDPKDESSSN